MGKWFVAYLVLVTVSLGLTGRYLDAQQQAPVVPPLLACQGEAYLLRTENTRLRVQLADREKRLQLYELLFKTDASAEVADLSARCRALEPSYREALKPADGVPFDCDTLTFKVKDGK